MRAHIARNWSSRTAAIFITDGGPAPRILQQRGADTWEWVAFQPEVNDPDLTPTLTLPIDAIEAVVAAAHDVLPPSAATARHLDDAIKVRDRLLSLVEDR